MSVESLALVLHHSRAKGTDKLVLIGIANHAGDGGAWPSKATLARYANVSPDAVKKALGRLVDSGELARELQQGWPTDQQMSDWHRPNLYRVLVECPEGCRGDANHRPLPGWERWADGTYAPVDNHPEDRGALTHPGGADAPRAGGADAPLTVTPTSDDQGSRSVTGTREAGRPWSDQPCAECSAPDQLACAQRQSKLRPEDQHTYTPRRRA